MRQNKTKSWNMRLQGDYAADAAKLLEAGKNRMPESVCLLVVSGSHAYKMADENSDLDIRGVYLNTLNDILLEKNPGSIELEEGDVLLHPLGRFMHLAAQGNPAVLEWLFTPEPLILYADEAGKRLIENRSLFLSRRMISAYLGYASQSWKQLNRMLEQAEHQNLRKMEKHARHLLRLLNQLIQLLETGSMDLDCTGQPQALHKDEQGVHLSQDYLEHLKSAAARIKSLEESTRLPEKVDRQTLDCLQKKLMYPHVKNLILQKEQSRLLGRDFESETEKQKEEKI